MCDPPRLNLGGGWGGIAKVQFSSINQFPTMTEILKINGMSCQGCVASVQKAISRLPVEKSEVEIGKAIVEFNETSVTHQQIVEAIEDAGFEVAATW